jgi:adenylate cyclase
VSRSSSAERWFRPRRLPLRHGLRWLIGLALLAALLGHATRHWQIPMLTQLERQLYDARLRLFAPTQTDARIVIVDIDERALARYGRWPWKRSLLAELIEKTFSPHGALLVGVDMILAEPDDSSGLSTLDALAEGALHDDRGFIEQLQTLRPGLDHDTRLAQTLKQHAVVLGYHWSNADNAARSGALPPPSIAPQALGAHLADLPAWRGYGANLAQLQDAAAQAGFLNAVSDADGVTRRMPLLSTHAGQAYAALPLVLAQTLMGNAAITPALAPLAGAKPPLIGLNLQTPRGALLVPTDAQTAVLVPYRADAGQYLRYSAADVLSGRLAPDALRGRVVLLGTSAPGLMDQRATPLGEAYPGVAVHASVLSGLMDGTLASVPGYTPALESALLAVIGIGLLLVLPCTGWLGASLVGALLLAALLGANFAAWTGARQAWPLATSLVLLAALLGLHLLFAYFGERGAKRRLSALFGHYVPPELVEQMSRQPGQYSMDGRSAELSVLFADVRGFTGIAERLGPTELAALMHDFFTCMTEVVRAHRGTLDKYMGDALMAFWGAPVDDAEHALHAVQAALAMQRALRELNRRFAAAGRPQLAIHIGINSGPMVVGDMGSRHRRAYTVLGDNVNLAARMQQLGAEWGVEVLITEATRQRVGALHCSALGSVQVRGRAAEVQVYQPLAAPDA